jgi:hypothetical protein
VGVELRSFWRVAAGDAAPEWRRFVVGSLVVAVGYWALARLGAVAVYTGNIQVAWLPVGFAAAMLYLGDLRWFVGGIVGDLALGNSWIPFHEVAYYGA